jgi:hypothetical protein
MGADLLIISLAARDLKKKKGDQTDDILGRLDKCQEVVDSWKSVKDIPAEVLEYIGEGDPNDATLESAIQQVSESIEYIRDNITNGSRDTACEEGGGGIRLWLTAGMSYGEEPTDSYPHFQRVLPIFPDARDEGKKSKGGRTNAVTIYVK